MAQLFPSNIPLPWLQPGVFVGALIPIPVMVWRGMHGELGADLIATVLNQLGFLALTFLVVTLLCTPLKIVTGWSWGIRLRRMLGLFAFFYASLHFLTYLIVDQALNINAVVADITKRNFILVGFTALLILIPLAVTSTNKMVRRLGFARWQVLHRLAYVAGCLGAIHFIWRVKQDLTEPLIFATLLAIGFGLRALDRLRTRTKKQRAAFGVQGR